MIDGRSIGPCDTCTQLWGCTAQPERDLVEQYFFFCCSSLIWRYLKRHMTLQTLFVLSLHQKVLTLMTLIFLRLSIGWAAGITSGAQNAQELRYRIALQSYFRCNIRLVKYRYWTSTSLIRSLWHNALRMLSLWCTSDGVTRVSGLGFYQLKIKYCKCGPSQNDSQIIEMCRVHLVFRSWSLMPFSAVALD